MAISRLISTMSIIATAIATRCLKTKYPLSISLEKKKIHRSLTKMVCTIVLGPFTGYNLDRLALLIGWVAVVYDLREDPPALRSR